MRVAEKRWGEVSIKKQGDGKNQFDGSRSFSIAKADHEYSIDQLETTLERIVNLTQFYDFVSISALLVEIERKGARDHASKTQ